ncbi:hypothetical protein [Mesorhizobium sp. P5_C1]|jgi:hypothetical protein
MDNLEMETPRIIALRTALRELHKAQDSAIAELADENSAENRKALHDIADTLKTLRSIQKEEQGIVTRILKWLHVIP